MIKPLVNMDKYFYTIQVLGLKTLCNISQKRFIKNFHRVFGLSLSSIVYLVPA